VALSGCRDASVEVSDALLLQTNDPRCARLADATTAEEVLRIRNEVAGLSEDEARRCSSAEFSTKDVNGDGKGDRVLLINFSCTADPAELFVACSTEGGFCLQGFCMEHGSLAECVRDLDGDGVCEILKLSCIESAGTPHASALRWVDVYAWTGMRFEERSANFKAYYAGEYVRRVSARLAVISRMRYQSDGTKPKQEDERAQVRAIIADCGVALARVTRLLDQIPAR
jgi:hypothetical protein